MYVQEENVFYKRDDHGKVQGFWFIGIYRFPISALKRPSGCLQFSLFCQRLISSSLTMIFRCTFIFKGLFIFLLLVKISAGFQNELTNYKTCDINNRHKILLDWPWFTYLFLHNSRSNISLTNSCHLQKMLGCHLLVLRKHLLHISYIFLN